MKSLRHSFTLGSHLRYLLWRALGLRTPLQVRQRDGLRYILRPHPATDLDMAYEIFFGQEYKMPIEEAPGSVRRIVDLGSNVGYTLLYWMKAYPLATIVGFEPHPANCAQALANVALRSDASRVSLKAVGVSNRAGRAWLSDEGAASRTVTEAEPAKVEMTVVDWFEANDSQPIDLLKMDIEGAEFDIILDERFANLDIGLLIMEWHQMEGSSQTAAMLEERLRGLGYRVESTPLGELPGRGMTFGKLIAEKPGFPARH